LASAAIVALVDPDPAGAGLAHVAPERGVIAERAFGAGVRLEYLLGLDFRTLLADPLELGLEAADRLFAG
jgi:hypothetical protein